MTELLTVQSYSRNTVVLLSVAGEPRGLREVLTPLLPYALCDKIMEDTVDAEDLERIIKDCECL